MRTTIILALAAIAQAGLPEDIGDWDSPVTEVVRRTFYTCPCDGVVSTGYETLTYTEPYQPWATVNLTTTTSSSPDYGTTSSSLSSTTVTTASVDGTLITSSLSSTTSATISVDGTLTSSSGLTTTSTLFTTSANATSSISTSTNFTTPLTTSANFTTSISTTTNLTKLITTTTNFTTPMTTTTITTSSSTTTSLSPVITDQVFIAQVQFTPSLPGKLVRRGTYYLGFRNRNAYLSESAADAWTLVVTADGSLVASDKEYVVGTTSTTGVADLSYFEDTSTIASGPGWQVGYRNALVYSGAEFCVRASDNAVRLVFGSAAGNDCTSVTMVPSTDCADCFSPLKSTTTRSKKSRPTYGNPKFPRTTTSTVSTTLVEGTSTTSITTSSSSLLATSSSVTTSNSITTSSGTPLVTVTISSSTTSTPSVSSSTKSSISTTPLVTVTIPRSSTTTVSGLTSITSSSSTISSSSITSSSSTTTTTASPSSSSITSSTTTTTTTTTATIDQQAQPTSHSTSSSSKSAPIDSPVSPTGQPTSAAPDCGDTLKQCNTIVSTQKSMTSRSYNTVCDKLLWDWPVKRIIATDFADCLNACDEFATASVTCGSVGYFSNPSSCADPKNSMWPDSNCALFSSANSVSPSDMTNMEEKGWIFARPV